MRLANIGPNTMQHDNNLLECVAPSMAIDAFIVQTSR